MATGLVQVLGDPNPKTCSLKSRSMNLQMTHRTFPALPKTTHPTGDHNYGQSSWHLKRSPANILLIISDSGHQSSHIVLTSQMKRFDCLKSFWNLLRMKQSISKYAKNIFAHISKPPSPSFKGPLSCCFNCVEWVLSVLWNHGNGCADPRSQHWGNTTLSGGLRRTLWRNKRKERELTTRKRTSWGGPCLS